MWHAIIGVGAIVSALNPTSTPEELQHHLNLTIPAYLIVQTGCLENLEVAASACNISQASIFVLHDANQSIPQGKQSWQLFLQHDEHDWDTSTAHHESIENKVASYNSTSGTTGLPKAAVISHGFVVAQTCMVEQRIKDKPYQVRTPFCV